MLTIVLMAFMIGGCLYARYRFRVWKAGETERRKSRAKTANEARRPLAQRVHTVLPAQMAQRLMAHKARREPFWLRWAEPKVTVARTGLITGSVRISPAQHIAAIGTTGSGKTSVLRVMAHWAKAQPDWKVTALDGKWGASAAPYRADCHVIDNITEIEAYLHHIVTVEFPKRGRMTKRPHLALIVDESRVFNTVSAEALSDLIVIMQTGRELGVHVWAGLQDFKTTSVPSEIRLLFTCKIVGLVPTAEDSVLIFKNLADAGWRPDKLQRAGQLLVWEPHRHRPRVCFGLWMSESTLSQAPNRVCLVKVPQASPVAVAPTPSTSNNTRATATATPLEEKIEMALLAGPAGVRQVAKETGINPGSAHRVLKRMESEGTVRINDDQQYELAGGNR